LRKLDKVILSVLKDIETGKLTIEYPPDTDTWMGNITYSVSNGWKIIIFSDCWCWDYIDSIYNKNNKLIYELCESPVRDYQPSDEVVENIYKIISPEKELLRRIF